jgi:hypothetical protein
MGNPQLAVVAALKLAVIPAVVMLLLSITMYRVRVSGTIGAVTSASHCLHVSVASIYLCAHGVVRSAVHDGQSHAHGLWHQHGQLCVPIQLRETLPVTPCAHMHPARPTNKQLTVPVRIVSALQHLAAGIVLSAIAVELVPVILATPNTTGCTVGIVVGFIGALMVSAHAPALCSVRAYDCLHECARTSSYDTSFEKALPHMQQRQQRSNKSSSNLLAWLILRPTHISRPQRTRSADLLPTGSILWR